MKPIKKLLYVGIQKENVEQFMKPFETLLYVGIQYREQFLNKYVDFKHDIKKLTVDGIAYPHQLDHDIYQVEARETL